MPQPIRHDYPLIARLLEANPASTYPELAAEYTRQSGIPIAVTVMRATIRRRETTRTMKQNNRGKGRSRRYSYEIIEWLIEEKPHLIDSPTRLMVAYKGLTGVEVTLSGMKHILRKRPERLAREEEARDGQVESEDSDQGFDGCSNPSDSAL